MSIGISGGLDLDRHALSIEQHQQVDLVAADADIAIDDHTATALQEGGGDVLPGPSDGHAVGGHADILTGPCDANSPLATTFPLMAFVKTEDRGAARWLTLSAPERKNAVPSTGWDEIADAIDDFAASEQRALVITGDGKDFCAGADLGGDRVRSTSAADNTARMRLPNRAALALHRVSKPTIAAVDGVAVGAGMNLAIGCDIVVATSRVRFAEIFVKRGLTMDFGGTWLLPRLVGMAKARELVLTGRMVYADEAEDIGLVTRVVEPDELAKVATEIADELAAGAPLAQRFLKEALDRSSALTFEQALAFEEQAQALLLGSEDVIEGAKAFFEDRPPDFQGR